MMAMELKESEYIEIRSLLRDAAGIDLGPGKTTLVRSRLWKELARLGLRGFGEYVRLVKTDPSGILLRNMVELLTTNYTAFFREESHFEFLQREYLPSFRSNTFRAWSAGCSSGEEAYCLAMMLREALDKLDRIDAKILATDISTRVLATARKGLYPEQRVESVPKHLRDKYFSRAERDGEIFYTVKPTLTALIAFRELNLVGPWPMKGPFDLIMCRNVLIYLENAARDEVVDRFLSILRPGGLLIVGHSEGFASFRPRVRQIMPSVYEKV